VAGSRAVLGQQDVDLVGVMTRARPSRTRDPTERKLALDERGAGNTANE
jgi:hypothetical protein